MAFVDFLNLTATVWRSTSFTINIYGELLPDDDTLQVSTKVRIDPLKGKGLTTMFQGQTVDITNRIFAVSNITINHGDILKIDSTNEQYEVLLIERLYDKANLHHLEIMARNVSVL